MASPSAVSSYALDDKDLDDAALWAVIDSAAASRSISAPKPLAIKYPNFNSPPTPVSHTSPPPKLPHKPNPDPKFIRRRREESPLPNKVAKSCAMTGICENESPLVLVRAPQRNSSPTIRTATFSLPESYLSPEIRRSSTSMEVSSPVSCIKNEVVNEMRHSLSGSFPSASLFKEYQNTAMAILEKSDFTLISGHTFIKKSGWRKISFYFNVSYEIKDKTIEFDENRNVQRAEFIVRAYMHGGRFSDGWGSCERREKRFQKPNHDIPSTAETRAKNRACQDLLGIGEYRPSSGQFPL